MPLSTTDRRLPRLIAAVIICAVVPVLAHQLLCDRVANAAAAVSRRLGRPAAIGFVEAGLAGTVTLYDVAVPGIARVGSLEARLALGGEGVGGVTRVAEVVVSEPVLFLRVAADGTSNISRMLEAIRRTRPQGPAAAATDDRSRARPRIRVANGRVRARLEHGIVVTASDVEVVDQGGRGIRLTTGPVVVRGTTPVAAELVFPKAAADIDASSGRIRRLIAPGGDAIIAGMPLTQLVASMGIGAQVELSARSGNGVLEYRRHDGSEQLVIDRWPASLFGFMAPRSVVLDDTVVGGTLTRQQDTYRAELEIDGLVLDHPLLASEHVRFDVAIDAGLSSLSPITSQFELGIGGARLFGDVVLHRAQPLRFDLDLELASVDCQQLLDAIPAALRKSLSGLHVAGDVAARAAVHIDGADSGVELDPTGECEVRSEPPLADPMRLAGPFDHRVGGRSLRVGEGSSHAALDALPRHVPAAFVAAEDSGFWRHRGFAWGQIARSLAANLSSDAGVLRGGSTISQQLVKNVYLSHERTLARKLQEAVITWRVEERIGKEVILDRYINIIELGPDVFGITEAARFWFDRDPRRLSPTQAAFLAALTRAPATESKRLLALRRVPPDLRDRIDEILLGVKHRGAIDAAAYAEALEEKLELRSGSRTAALKTR